MSGRPMTEDQGFAMQVFLLDLQDWIHGVLRKIENILDPDGEFWNQGDDGGWFCDGAEREQILKGFHEDWIARGSSGHS